MQTSKFRKIGILASVAVAIGLAIYTVNAPADAPQYLTATAERGDIENAVLATGLLEGVKQVDVGAQVSGQLKSLKVKVGDKVKKGQWLAEIDPLILQNTLRKAQVDEENLQAQRRATAAQLKQAKSVYERYKGLQADESVSRQDFEDAESTYQVSRPTCCPWTHRSKARTSRSTPPRSTWPIPASTRPSTATWWVLSPRKARP